MIIKKEFPNIKYAATLLGPGSETLGFDDHLSMDHHWGPRLFLFLSDGDYPEYKKFLEHLFRTQLPYQFMGFSTNWTKPDPLDSNTQLLKSIADGEVNHRIEIYTVSEYLFMTLGIKSTELSDLDWLLLPEQRLLEFTGGKVFEDSLGELTQVRRKLHYFPRNVWFYKILAQWNKIAEEIAFPGPLGIREDELGGQLECARLVRYAMILCLILSQKYVPYPKWLSFSFSQLAIAKKTHPLLYGIMNEKNYLKRDDLLCQAYLQILDYQNSLGITDHIAVEKENYFSRPITIIDVGKILNALQILIQSPLDHLKYPVGSVDQLIDYPNILSDAHMAKKLRSLYEDP